MDRANQKDLKARKASRTAFTRLYNQVEKRLEEDKVSEAKAMYNMLQKEWTKLQELDSKILDEMLDREELIDEDLDKEQESSQEYGIRFELLKLKMLAIECKGQAGVDNIDQNEDAQSNLSVSSSHCKSLKLPPISIETFDGELKNWLPFWGQFEHIHNDEAISTFHKFRILHQSMKPGSRAKQVVDSFPVSKDMKNYDAAVGALKERYGREDLLIEVYIRELLEMIINNSKTAQLSLVEMYDKLECHLRFLEILGVTSGKSAAILCPLLESCTSEDFLRVWQRSYSSGEIKDAEERLAKFREFIKSEVQNEQRITLAMSKFGISDKSESKSSTQRRDTRQKSNASTPTAMGLFTGNGGDTKRASCIFCEQSHSSTDCYKARDMSLDDKLKKVRDLKCCYLCLKKSHSSKQCKIRTSCQICDRKHALILCPNYCRSKTQSVQDNARTVSGDKGDTAVNVATSKCDDTVLLPTLQVRLTSEQGKSCLARAIIDTAAQRSYILNSTAEQLNLRVIGEESLYHSLFGGKRTRRNTHKKFQVSLSSVAGDYKCKIEFLGQDVICGELPTVPKGPWIDEMKEAGIKFSDLSMEKGPIDILLGADVAGLFYNGNVKRLSSGTLVCFETSFGWTVSGKLPSRTVYKPEEQSTATYLTTTMFCNTLNVSDLWRLDLIGIDDPTEHKHKNAVEADVKRHFLETVKVNEEGRYEVNLPWKENHIPLPTNFDLAAKRLVSTVKKLESDGHLAEYQNVFDEWKAESVIEEIPQSNEGHFIPHRHVVKLSSTTKIRPVFDASAHQRNAPSLNNMLEKGCNVIEQIPPLLHRFRLHKIGVVADIRRAFLQISINPNDRKFLKFLWYDSDKELVVYQHNRVMFGLTSSPFLLGAVIDYHLDKTKERALECNEELSVQVIDTLKLCFYVDNVVHSVASESQLQAFITNATEIMANGKFDLRGWEHTDRKSNPLVLTAVLGMHWNRSTDTLEINTENFDLHPDKVTKRIIMSTAHKIFDPIGIVGPVTICPKLLMKELWKLKAEWDEDVPEHIKLKFVKWLEELKYLKNVKVPRCLFVGEFTHVSIHTFTDASELSYATVIFVRVESNHEVKVQLVQSKTRVSPEKRVTIPRLELLAANVGARLFNAVKTHFNVKEEDTYFWSDSTTVIAWIRRQENWGVFVSNRVNEIRSLTDPNRWHHIPGVMNPADLPSRGCLGKTLVETAWWEGPEWLYLPANTWPTSNTQEFNEDEISSEKKKHVAILVTNTAVVNDDWYYRYFSNYQKCVRMVSWVRRFIDNCRATIGDIAEKKIGALTIDEISAAEVQILKLIQTEAFEGVNDMKIAQLRPFTDASGLIRLRTKICNKPDSYDFRFPILLPKNHPLVMRIIHRIHVTECHVGIQGLLAILRERYWVIGGRRVIKSVVTKCVICRKHESKKIEAPSPSLPVDRVRAASAFEVVGVDLAGPLFLRDNKKAWICLFTCGVVRAIHLELLPSLSTEDFILGLRRFIARRGRPARIYCDQGTNFRGAHNLFKKIDFSKVLEYSEVYKITWKFNPPAAPWWGGWWERLVGLTKRLLRKVLGKSTLNYVEMETVLCDCESVLNSRPLTFISEGVPDAYPITPSLFIQDIKEAGLPELDVIESKSLDKKWLHRQKLKQNFRKRFRSEYLGMLSSRANKCKDTSNHLKIGDVVLIGNDNTKRLDWPLAKIEDLIPGRDGRVRVVRLKSANGELIRPIQRVYPLLEGQPGIN